jgi:hypothetical protein
MSYTIRRFLPESDGNDIPLDAEFTESDIQILPQGHIKSGKKGRKRSQSKVSRMSMQSCGTSYSLMSQRYSHIAANFVDFGVNPVSGAGDWFSGREDATCWGPIPWQ